MTEFTISSLTNEKRETKILTRRGAFVTKRPEDKNRVVALPPPPKKSKSKSKTKTQITDRKSIIIESKKVLDDDEDDENDDEGKEKREVKQERKARIVRRSVMDWDEKYDEYEELPRYVAEKESVYIDEKELVIRERKKKSWWTKVLTGCMPSGDL